MNHLASSWIRRHRAWPVEDLRLTEGDVPMLIAEPLRVTRHWQISRNAFRMMLPSGLAFHYHRGRGTTFARNPNVSDAEVALFFDGSVRGAIAWLGGFMPLHASAVVHDGAVYAFTGASGEGKSTLVAALARAGFVTFCDDVLVIDPAAIEGPVGLPGHKRLKLWRDALALTGHRPIERVRPDTDKFFVEGYAACSDPLPVRCLYVLETMDGAAPDIVPVRGTERFIAVREAQYRRSFGTASSETNSYFRATMQLAEGLEIRRFLRSRERTAFIAGVDTILADIHASSHDETLTS